MDRQEINQIQLQFAIDEARVWLENMPSLTHHYICQRIVDSITSHYRGHDLILFQLEIKRIKNSAYSITVNRCETVVIEIVRQIHE